MMALLNTEKKYAVYFKDVHGQTRMGIVSASSPREARAKISETNDVKHFGVIQEMSKFINS